MILFYFPSGGCVDDVFDNQTNYQFISVIAIHFMNGAEVGISQELFLMYSSAHTTKLKGVSNFCNKNYCFITHYCVKS